MLPFIFSHFLFVRSPAYSISDFEQPNITDLLNDPFFRAALHFASRDLYNQIEVKNFNFEALDSRARDSLLKYYNRMCYRATPFGLCSSFSTTNWSNMRTEMIFNGVDKLHIKTDFRLSKKIVLETVGEKLLEPFYFNASSYRVGSELRYVKSLTDSNSESGSYGISVVKHNRMIKSLIARSKDGISFHEIIDFFLQRFPDSDPEDILREFLLEELLHSAKLPNVTGENYLERLSGLSGDAGLFDLLSSVESLRNPLCENLETAEDTINAITSDADIRNAFYVNYGRGVGGTVNNVYQSKLLQGIHCLYQMHETNNDDPMSKFRKQFMEKFENREVSLLHALDPDVGIGYGALEGSATEGQLLQDISFSKPVGPKKITWGSVQAMIVNKMILANGEDKIIINDEDLAGLETKARPLSSGMSVIFRIHGDKVFIEAAGGVCATALIGRFTAFDEKTLSEARLIAKAEQEANPEVIFAEIAYFTDEHAANINLRGHIYDYEVPVLVHSTLKPEHIIRLNDLMVSVQGDELILRSSKLNKRIIPRLNSAYNHVRSELPIFRFLADLQYQKATSTLGLKFEELVPGLRFYPRIEYKDCILSEASWFLASKDFSEIEDVDTFLQLAAERRLSRYFALSNSDRQLVFDLESVKSIEMLLREIKKKDQITLKEFFMPEDSDPVLQDKVGKVFVSQLIAFLINPLPTYKALTSRQQVPNEAVHLFFPGSNWIYLKIYCSEQIAGDILIRKIYPLLKKKSAEIDKWFFIRYQDPDHHIRVRIQARHAFMKDIPFIFNKLLQKFTKASLISRIQTDTYKPEIARYGVKTIELVEKVFQCSSEVIAEHLLTNPVEERILRFGILSLDEIFNSFEMELPWKISLLEKACTSLMNEQGTEKDLRRDLNKKYRVYHTSVMEAFNLRYKFLTKQENKKFQKFKTELSNLRKGATTFELFKRSQLALDVLHMHMNRLFNSEQRKNELILYYLCLRFYISLKARVHTCREEEISLSVI